MTNNAPKPSFSRNVILACNIMNVLGATIFTLCAFIGRPVASTLCLVTAGIIVLNIAIQVYYLYINYIIVPPTKIDDNNTNDK